MKPLTKEGTPRALGRFELVAELASGGMATVFLGRLGGAGGFQRFVAIKRLHSHLANDSEFVDMFLDEARLAARLHHPNVVPILEIGQSELGYYLVMEYVEGETLARLLNLSHQAGAPVPTNVTVRIFLDVLEGLHAAHELVGDDGAPLDIVHRDVSPQNVLVGVEGAAKITDFGVAHAADRLAHTRTGQLKGKFSYMAPEQALGTNVDRRADVFAVGTCLWEALACRRLFKGDNEADTLEKVLRGPIPRLRSIQRNLHPAIEAVVAKALERDPNARFASCAAFAEALERAAIQAGVLGTQRDVMTHVQRVLGPLLSQQREAVRAWIAGMEREGRNSHPDGADRGPTTRVDVPRGTPSSRRPSGASVPPSSSMRNNDAATVGPKARPLLASMSEGTPEPANETRPSADSSASVAVGAMERSTVTRAPAATGTSMLATYAVAGLVIAIGALVGVSRLRASAAGEGVAEASKPMVTTTMAAAPGAATAGTTSPSAAPNAQATANAMVRLGAPPVPTTPLNAIGALGPTSSPPGAPGVPTVSVTELPGTAGAAARPAPVAARESAPPVRREARPSPRVAPAVEDRPEPRVRREPRPEPRFAEPREAPRAAPAAAGGDDDLGRNPYR